MIERRIMEVCGTHTMSVYRHGLKKLLPEGFCLISGPGCPVCVTPAALLARALALSRRPGFIITSFGDMLRVPLHGDSLLKARDEGADVRLVLSPLEALEIAAREQAREVVFLAVGFETTAPLAAATLQMAMERGIKNFSVLNVHRTMPEALRAVLTDSPRIDGLLLPGHVSAVTGADYFGFVPRELAKPAVVAGFEPGEIMVALKLLIAQLDKGECCLQNAYPQAVRAKPAPAWAVLNEVFEPADALWRGLGRIENSGLALRPAYAGFDAEKRFGLADISEEENPACCCGEVLRGAMRPRECLLFGRSCSPESPEGACMVSSEGACAAVYRYEGNES